MALTFDANYYLSQRPDVFQAFVATSGSTGLTWEQFAEQHYNQYGRFEGSNPNAVFNTNEYLAANPDVAAAGVNPFQHYLEYGVYEGRAPNATFPTFASFDYEAYLTANPDLAAAGIDTANEAYAHFVVYGQYEDRPGAPEVPNNTNPGEVIALKQAVEVAQGTSGDDVFTGVIDGNPLLATLTSGDSVVGGAGNDTLRVTVSSASNVVADLNSVEKVEVRAFDAGGLNLASAVGVKQVDVSGTGGAVTVQNLKNIVDASVSETSTFNLAYAAATVSGNNDIQKLAVNSANSAFTVNGIETLNITATGAEASVEENRLALNAGNTLKTLNIAGDGKLNLTTALGASTTVVDASQATGDVRVKFGAAADVTVTGGKGNDTFDFDTTLTKADVVNGGDGNDTVIVRNAAATDYSAATAVEAFNSLKSIETLKFGGNGGVTVNGSTLTNAEITTLAFDTNGADVINNATTARTYEFGAVNGGSATFNMAGSSTTLNLTLAGTDPLANVAKDGATADIAGVTVALSGTAPAGSVATINIHSIGDLATGAANTTGNITAVGGSTIVIDGNANLRIAGLNDHATVDASAHTGSLVITGSNFDGTNGIAGGGGSKTTITDSGVDTIKLGANNLTDTIKFAVGGATQASGTIVVDDTAAHNVTGILHDVVSGFTAGASGDILDIDNGGAAVGFTSLVSTAQDQINLLAGSGATLQAAADIAANAHGTADWTAFSFQGTTYALYEANADIAGGFTNGDVIVELTGVNVSALTAANFA